MINKKFNFILLALSLISYTGISQNPVFVERESINENLQIGEILLQEEKVLNYAGTISSARFRTDTVPQLLSNTQAILKNILSIRKDDELREIITTFAAELYDVFTISQKQFKYNKNETINLLFGSSVNSFDIGCVWQ